MAVTSINNLKYGSKGADVSELQKKLNTAGYGLAVDGDFGSATQAAVKDYQSKNGLTVDGIVGVQTWSKLTGADAPAAESQTSTGDRLSKLEEGYKPSQAVTQAQDDLDKVLSAKPGEFTSSYDGELQDLYNQLINRKDFSYDMGRDPMYGQYKDMYTALGELAMMDTMGQAAALTGGYGSTYAENAGYQAYSGYLQGLNDKALELYGLALDRYNAESDALAGKTAAAEELYNMEYGLYRDAVEAWENERNFAQDRYDSLLDSDRDDYYRELGYWQDKAEAEQEQANWQTQWDYKVSQSGSSGASGSDSKSGTTSDPSQAGDTAHLLFPDNFIDSAHTIYSRLGDTELRKWLLNIGKTWGYSLEELNGLYWHVRNM